MHQSNLLHYGGRISMRAAPTEIDRAGPIDRTLLLGHRLLDAVDFHLNAHARSLSELGDITLPPVVGSADDQVRVQSIAPLYLASELEAAQLVPAVETLAGLFANGGLQFDVGPAGSRLLSFWRSRNERLTAHEREALFHRLFAEPLDGPSLPSEGPANTDFEALLFNLAEALFQLQSSATLGEDPADNAKVSTSANALADNLVNHSGGFASVAAREVLQVVHEALDILKVPIVQQAVHSNSVWSAVRAINQDFLGRQIDVESRVIRGKSGLLILAWLAQVTPQLGQITGRLVAPNDPVVAAAGAWLQASLSLREGQEASVPSRTGPLGRG